MKFRKERKKACFGKVSIIQKLRTNYFCKTLRTFSVLHLYVYTYPCIYVYLYICICGICGHIMHTVSKTRKVLWTETRVCSVSWYILIGKCSYCFFFLIQAAEILNQKLLKSFIFPPRKVHLRTVFMLFPLQLYLAERAEQSDNPGKRKLLNMKALSLI